MKVAVNLPLPVCIIGGGLAGLTCAILLSKNGFAVTVVEKKQIPFQRVCGEYISNEVLSFLKSIHINLENTNSSELSRLSISSVTGKSLTLPLKMGGFGLSRDVFDNLLYQQAKANGVTFIFSKANNIAFADEQFTVDLSTGEVLQSKIVIATYGKRSNMDQKLNRAFFYQRSPYLGVKYHIKTDMAKDLIRLDIFKGGYCGTCKIQDDLFNLCYLSETKNLKDYSSIPEMEQGLLYKNPHLKYLFNNSEFVFEKPEVINEISFNRKSLIEDHILFCGDAAGMITPLCGNGMAMAIRSGKILAEIIIENGQEISPSKRLLVERNYSLKWKNEFALRLRTGRFIQKLFLNPHFNRLGIDILKKSKFISRMVISRTHGKSF
ncbi:MAG: NAD(P)/FAD-dependent oxidoreductase [Flavobacterium sp.]|nr:NAD(P)/FAD-dependent oxidoreductase [Pedobacter sp.]